MWSIGGQRERERERKKNGDEREDAEKIDGAVSTQCLHYFHCGRPEEADVVAHMSYDVHRRIGSFPGRVIRGTVVTIIPMNRG